MTDTVLGLIESKAGNERIAVVQRTDKTFSYRHQLLEDGQWGKFGPYCGVYDSALTAETEAMQRIDWLKSRWQ